MHDHRPAPEPNLATGEREGTPPDSTGQPHAPSHSMWWMVACCAPMLLVVLALLLGVFGPR